MTQRLTPLALAALLLASCAGRPEPERTACAGPVFDLNPARTAALTATAR